MREDDRRRATEFVKELYAAGDIDAARLDTGISGLLRARTEADLAEVVRSLPALQHRQGPPPPSWLG